MQIRVNPDMAEYIKKSSSELRICTTCEGPILLPIKLRPPKSTDVVIEVEGRKLYISALQATRIEAIDSRMMPRCSLKDRKWLRKPRFL